LYGILEETGSEQKEYAGLIGPRRKLMYSAEKRFVLRRNLLHTSEISMIFPILSGPAELWNDSAYISVSLTGSNT
jgi:hypothetical protein